MFPMPQSITDRRKRRCHDLCPTLLRPCQRQLRKLLHDIAALESDRNDVIPPSFRSELPSKGVSIGSHNATRLEDKLSFWSKGINNLLKARIASERCPKRMQL